ncbi:response regulator [Mangrovibacter plantisponsor]|uniref:Response regulator receiver domain-containing protein n=1 Tax=Mangrovibacter plantisponsor TaxID=451513 RepID=A0A317Q3B2_9ENTR|nr:response regulator [Mangrovibacter plantisponsor]PWW09453.1 response regulator receiver domain-containing protein [Mangrovibacter plantisponsor]
MPHTDPCRILVVDDHPLIRKGVRQLIELEDDLVIIGEAENGQQTLDQVAALMPDLVILDLNMSGMSGLEALRILRAQQTIAHVLILTISDAPEDMQAALAAGADDYLVKDNDPELLLTAIKVGATRGRERRQRQKK